MALQLLAWKGEIFFYKKNYVGKIFSNNNIIANEI